MLQRGAASQRCCTVISPAPRPEHIEKTALYAPYFIHSIFRPVRRSGFAAFSFHAVAFSVDRPRRFFGKTFSSRPIFRRFANSAGFDSSAPVSPLPQAYFLARRLRAMYAALAVFALLAPLRHPHASR